MNINKLPNDDGRGFASQFPLSNKEGLQDFKTRKESTMNKTTTDEKIEALRKSQSEQYNLLIKSIQDVNESIQKMDKRVDDNHNQLVSILIGSIEKPGGVLNSINEIKANSTNVEKQLETLPTMEKSINTLTTRVETTDKNITRFLGLSMGFIALAGLLYKLFA